MRKCLIIGDFILDEFCYYNKKELAKKLFLPGGAGNVFFLLKKIGIPCDFACAMDNSIIKSNIFKNVKKSLIQIKDNVTTIKQWNINNKTVIPSDKICKISKETYDDLIKKIELNIHRYDIIIFSDYLKGFCSKYFTNKICSIAQKNSIKILIDSKHSTDFSNYYTTVDYLKINKYEFLKLFNCSLKNTTTIFQTMNKLSIKNLIVTLGKVGAICFCNDKVLKYKIKQSTQKNIIDIGAGDAFLSMLAKCIKNNLNLEKSLDLCCNFATQYTTNNTKFREIMNE